MLKQIELNGKKDEYQQQSHIKRAQPKKKKKHAI